MTKAREFSDPPAWTATGKLDGDPLPPDHPRRWPGRSPGRVHGAAMYWGLGAYLGRARAQNTRGHLLGHVIDITLPQAFAGRYGSVTIGDRGGIDVPGMRQQVPLSAY